MKRFSSVVAGLIAIGAFAIQAAEAQVARGGGRGPNGGAAAGQIHDRTGPNGTTIVGGRGVATDGQGNSVAKSANCAKGSSATACRAGSTTRTADGSVNHNSGFTSTGPNGGAVSSTGGLTKSADGTIDQSRSTSATGQNGSVTIDQSYNSGTGRSRTVTCTDPTGAVVTCPQP